MVAEHGEVLESFALGNLQGNGCRGRGCFKADGEKDHLTVGVFAGDLDGVHGRVDHADVGAFSLGLEQRHAVAGRHTHRVGVGAQNHAAVTGEFHRHVNAADGQHTDRAARTVNHAEVFRQQIGEAPAREHMGVTAAEFHEAVLTLGTDFLSNLTGDAFGVFALTVFGNVLHIGGDVLRKSVKFVGIEFTGGFERGKGALSLLLINTVKGETDVNNNPVTRGRIVNQSDVDIFFDAADVADSHIGTGDFGDLPGNSQTHNVYLQ